MFSKTIHINSKDCIKINDNYNSHFKYILTSKFKLELYPWYDVFINISNAMLPISFYLVNQYNNNLIIEVNTIEYNYYIPIGNYNLSNYVDTLNALISALNITVSYSTTNYKITFTGTSTFKIKNSSCYPFIGMTTGDKLCNELFILTSNIMVNFLGITSLSLKTNFDIKNINSSLNSDDIMESIIITEYEFGDVMNYTNVDSNKRFQIYDRKIDYIEIEIYDNYNNFIDFNGIDVEITFSLYYSLKSNYNFTMSDKGLLMGIINDNNNNDLIKSTK